MDVRIIKPNGYAGRAGELACGAVVSLPDALAIKLIMHGIAVREIEAAVVSPPRNAARRTTKPEQRKAVKVDG